MNVFFFHAGNQPYLETAIRHATQDNKVILIGDESNSHLGALEKVTHVYLGDCSKDVDRFLSLYKHLHTGGKQFEEWCFIRWFAIRNVAEQLGLTEAFYSDSDNLIYSDLNEVYIQNDSPSLALSVPAYQPPYRHSATGEVSYWSYDKLNEFCNFILNIYEDEFDFGLLTDKWAYHLENNLAGGICDMTVLWHFCNENSHKVITKILSGNTTFDHSINNASNYENDEYLMENGLKKIEFIDGNPYGFNLIHQKKVRFHNLQFQGNTKHLMESYVRDNNSR